VFGPDDSLKIIDVGLVLASRLVRQPRSAQSRHRRTAVSKRSAVSDALKKVYGRLLTNQFRQFGDTILNFSELARFTVELQTRRGLLSFSLGERGEPRLRGRAGTAG